MHIKLVNYVIALAQVQEFFFFFYKNKLRCFNVVEEEAKN